MRTQQLREEADDETSSFTRAFSEGGISAMTGPRHRQEKGFDAGASRTMCT